MMTKTLAYLRVSGLGQVEGDGFERQRLAVEKYAKANGFEVVAEYRDEGVSGCTEFDQREGLAALLDRIDSNGVRHVLVERADRLARDLMVGEILLAEFRKRGVTVISAEGGVDLTNASDPTATLIRQVLGAVAQFERSVIVAKLKAARDRASDRAGRRIEGRKPYGSKPGEAETIVEIKALRRKPKGQPRPSLAAIAATLNDRGIPGPDGGRWHPGAVGRILAREATR